MNPTVVGIIGGTGLYELDGLQDVEVDEVDTPFGKPSSPIVSGVLDGVRLRFIARHGPGHVLLPGEINFRANIYALKMFGVQWCLSVSAVGSLREEIAPGDVVIPDQFIDRTKTRPSTFFGEGLCAHVPFADPICPQMAELLDQSAAKAIAASPAAGDAAARPVRVHRGAVYVCIEGPAFSTRAESMLYRSWGASVVGMTALPEAKLAREAELGYGIMAMVTDYDCWRSADADVDVAEILDRMEKNAGLAKRTIALLLPLLAAGEPSALARNALAHSFITNPNSIAVEAKEKLAPIVGRYFS